MLKYGDGKIKIHDHLDFLNGTIYSGDESCAQDYFDLVRYRFEKQFAAAVYMLGTTCNNARKPTGIGRLSIEIKGVYTIHLSWFRSFVPFVKIFLKSENEQLIYNSTEDIKSRDSKWC